MDIHVNLKYPFDSKSSLYYILNGIRIVKYVNNLNINGNYKVFYQILKWIQIEVDRI